MNKPLRPPPHRDRITPDYNGDAYGWAMAQAQFIRERRMELVDWDNVAEEIESMGRSEARAVESALRIVLLHQLKWTHQPLYRSRSWRNSIEEHLRQFDEELADNPGLQSKLPEILARAYRRACSEAAQETGLLPTSFPSEPPSWDAIRATLSL